MIMSGTSEVARRSKILTCPACGKNFDGEEMLNAHRKMDHSGNDDRPAGLG
jgi:hypothetical protein